jgi:nucleoside 2-deoxyribosyltransferase
MSKKVYFAGSIRGGRNDAELYRRMIEFIQKTDIVLTEHVGNPAVIASENGQTDVQIYNQDTSWLRESDIVIAECTTPSLGVGYELAFAERFDIPCHILYNSSRTSLSAMLSGDPYFIVHPYTTEDEVFEILKGIL